MFRGLVRVLGWEWGWLGKGRGFLRGVVIGKNSALELGFFWVFVVVFVCYFFEFYCYVYKMVILVGFVL